MGSSLPGSHTVLSSIIQPLQLHKDVQAKMPRFCFLSFIFKDMEGREKPPHSPARATGEGAAPLAAAIKLHWCKRDNYLGCWEAVCDFHAEVSVRQKRQSRRAQKPSCGGIRTQPRCGAAARAARPSQLAPRLRLYQKIN